MTFPDPRLRRRSTLALLAAALATAFTASIAAGASLARPADAAPQRAEEPAATARTLRCADAIGAELHGRTELYFGLSRPGGVVTEAEFQAFVDERVTPLFPDGLTLLSGSGQFRDATNTIVVEGSKVLILLYPRRDAGASARIETIRAAYKRLFQQQSVLRTDEPTCAAF